MENIQQFIDFIPRKICEVGVFRSDCIHSLNLLKEDTKMMLVEPNPNCVKELKDKFQNDNRITIYPLAISLKRGKIKLYNRKERNGQDASGFIEDVIICPATINDGYKKNEEDAIIVDSALFSDIDNGDIDILCVDTEGAEWFVLKNLVSRPKIITLETHGFKYTNPYLYEILSWMDKNNYSLIGKDSSDSIFKKNDL